MMRHATRYVLKFPFNCSYLILLHNHGICTKLLVLDRFRCVGYMFPTLFLSHCRHLIASIYPDARLLGSEHICIENGFPFQVVSSQVNMELHRRDLFGVWSYTEGISSMLRVSRCYR